MHTYYIWKLMNEYNKRIIDFPCSSIADCILILVRGKLFESNWISTKDVKNDEIE